MDGTTATLWFITQVALLTLTYLPKVGGQCEVVTIFQQLTARCNNKNFKTVPEKLPPNVKVLRFNDNQITVLSMDAFKRFSGLQELFLARNRIDTIAPDAFRGLLILQILDLETNKLEKIPTEAFVHLKSVRILSLKDNPIRFIPKDAFSSLSSRIEELDFANCLIQKVDPLAFAGLSRLIEINLVNNELKKLSSTMVTALPGRLIVVRLYRNPWKCDCHLRWLKLWSMTTKVNWDFGRNTPQCDTPEKVRIIFNTSFKIHFVLSNMKKLYPVYQCEIQCTVIQFKFVTTIHTSFF